MRCFLLLIVLVFLGCAGKDVSSSNKMDQVKKSVTDNCLKNKEYELIIAKKGMVDIKHKTEKTRISYSSENHRGILMLTLGDVRTNEVSGIRECAAPYMKILLEELYKEGSSRQVR